MVSLATGARRAKHGVSCVLICTTSVRPSRRKSSGASTPVRDRPSPDVVPSCVAFAHTEGCTLCQSLFPHHKLPDGRVVHYFHKDNLSSAVSAWRRVWVYVYL